MLTVKNLADLLNVSRWTIHNRIRDGELKAIKIGGLWMISFDEYYEYVARASAISGETLSPQTNPFA